MRREGQGQGGEDGRFTRRSVGGWGEWLGSVLCRTSCSTVLSDRLDSVAAATAEGGSSGSMRRKGKREKSNGPPSVASCGKGGGGEERTSRAAGF